MSGVPEATPVLAEGSARVPPSVEQILILARYQLRDYIRARRFLILFGVVAAIGAILTVVVAHYRPAGIIDSASGLYGNLWGGGVTFVIILTAVFFGGDAIAGEFQNKTGYFLMGLPVRRATVYAGKYIAAFLASLSMVAIYALIIIVNAVVYLGPDAFPWQLGLSFLLAVVYLMAVLGVTFLFSSLFKVSTYGTVLTAILFLFGFSLLQTLVQVLANVTPWFVISYAQTVIGAVLSDNCFSQPGTHVCSTGGPGGQGFTETVTNPTVPEGVAIMIVYFLVTALVGLLRFEREEFS
jgi:ABC-2 type transport system permease protein